MDLKSSFTKEEKWNSFHACYMHTIDYYHLLKYEFQHLFISGILILQDLEDGVSVYNYCFLFSAIVSIFYIVPKVHNCQLWFSYHKYLKLLSQITLCNKSQGQRKRKQKEETYVNTWVENYKRERERAKHCEK